MIDFKQVLQEKKSAHLTSVSVQDVLYSMLCSLGL